MITREQVQIGTRVKNVNSRSFYSGKTGYIDHVNDYMFIVKYDGSEFQSFSWVDDVKTWFDLVHEYRKANVKDIVPGAKIRSNDNIISIIRNKAGTITNIRDYGADDMYRYIDISWDDNTTEYVSWHYTLDQCAFYFDVLDDGKKTQESNPRYST